jgi:hypothetical protein
MRFVFALWLVLGVTRAADLSAGLPPEFRHALESANEVTLYSLEPLAYREDDSHHFYNYQVLGSARLKDEEARHAAQAFEAAASPVGDGLPDCFDPRHALHVVSGGHTYDFLLCYHCVQMELIEDGNPVGTLGAGGTPDELNRLLRRHHIPISHSGDKK